MRISRRSVLKGLAAAPLVGACEGRPTPPPVLVRDRIKTVVFVMMENRSFDHMFGSYSLLEGRTDVDGLTADMNNKLADGTPIFPAPADVMCLEDDPAHGFERSHEQFNGGLNDGFVRVHEDRYGTESAHRVMGYLDRTTAPASYALADNYALCQRWFASVMGPTWPNRYYSMLATSNGNKSNVPIETQLPSLFSQLDGSRIPWKQYYGNIPFSLLLLGHSLEQEEYQDIKQFSEDAQNGTLPPYVHIDPTYGLNDDHPPAHPMAGQILLASIYAELANSPQWNECMLVITYDEHGGFFDHVPPPTTVDAFDEFQQMGFRVPALVVGPYVKKQVSSTVFDHTSTIATLCRMHELGPVNARDEAANDLLGLLDVDALEAGTPAPPITIPPIEVDQAELDADACHGFGLHRAPGSSSLGGKGMTGQPELEAFMDAHPSSKDGRATAASSWARIVERAKELGVIR